MGNGVARRLPDILEAMVLLRCSRWVVLLWGLAIAMASAASGCQKSERSIDGVGGWSLERTTLSDAEGVCSPQGDLTWCHSNPPITLGDQQASVDLYFRGEGDDAPLVEIVLSVNVCRVRAIEALLSGQLGEPDRRKGALRRWEQDHAVTFLQAEKGRRACEVNIVSPGDEKRIEELWAGRQEKDAQEGEDES